MKQNKLQEITFQEENLETFSQGILQIIKDNIELDKSIENKIILGEKPNIKIYLDLKRNIILCNIKLKYKKQEIGYFEYLKDKRQWQVVLFNQTRLNLKRNTKAEDIIGYSQAFIQISQSAIVNVNYLAMIDGKCCQLYPPFHDKSDLVISRSFLKGLQDRFFVL